MARVQNPIIGQAINQAGGMIFSVWKQIKVMRSKPLSVANPNSPAQQAIRRRMALIASLMREVLQGIRLGFVRYQNGTTQWAQFLKENFATATTDNGTIAAITVNALKFAKGTLLGVSSFVRESASGQLVDTSWDDNSGQPGAAASDVLHVMLVNADGSAVAYIATTTQRSAASYTITCPADIVASTAKVYAFFVNTAGDDVSDSQLAAFN